MEFIHTKPRHPRKSTFKFQDYNQILNLCFRPLYYPVKLMGLFPIRILKDGSSEFKWLSKHMLITISALVSFIVDSIIFLPFVFEVMGTRNSSFMEYAADFAFSAGNYITAISAGVLTFYVSPRLSKIWNELNIIIQFLAESGVAYKFESVRRSAIHHVALWASFFFVYFGLNWWYFDQHLKLYFGSSGSTFYFMSIAGQMVLTSLISAHVLYSMIFFIFCYLLTQSFKGLGRVAEFNCTEEKFEKLENLLGIYEQLVHLVYLLGGSYGIYLVVEVLAMVVCTATSTYFIFSGIRSGPTNISSLIACIGWLFMVCNTGEQLWQAAYKCQRSLKRAALLCHVSGRVMAARLAQNPPYVTACNYFSINRVLLTKIIGTIATYLVVLLQFHFKTIQSSRDA